MALLSGHALAADIGNPLNLLAVADRAENIIDVVRHLKKLVAEQAFFCFLTDRTYFEELVQRSRDEPYPVETMGISSPPLPPKAISSDSLAALW